MRAKLQINSIEKFEHGEKLTMHAVSKPEGYGDDGHDENNTYAKYTPAAELTILIQNPELFEKFKPGQKLYVDFSPAPNP